MRPTLIRADLYPTRQRLSIGGPADGTNPAQYIIDPVAPGVADFWTPVEVSSTDIVAMSRSRTLWLCLCGAEVPWRLVPGEVPPLD